MTGRNKIPGQNDDFGTLTGYSVDMRAMDGTSFLRLQVVHWFYQAHDLHGLSYTAASTSACASGFDHFRLHHLRPRNTSSHVSHLPPQPRRTFPRHIARRRLNLASLLIRWRG